MKVSIISPFVNKNQKILVCIKSLKNQNYKNIEIIVLSEKVKLNIRDVKSIFNPKERSVSEKRNYGAKIATGDVLLFLDYDCIAKKDSIENLVKVFQETEADAVTGKTLAPKNGNLLGIATGLEYEDRFDQMGEGYVDVAATTCFAVRKKVFENVGGFQDYSKKHRAVGEDWDFSSRLRKKGYKIYHTNKFQVIHNHNDETLQHWFKRRVQHSRYRVVHLKKHKQAADQYSSWKMFLSSTVLLSIPTVIRMFRKTKNTKLFALPIYALLRNIAWLIGFISGFIEMKRRKY